MLVLLKKNAYLRSRHIRTKRETATIIQSDVHIFLFSTKLNIGNLGQPPARGKYNTSALKYFQLLTERICCINIVWNLNRTTHTKALNNGGDGVM